MCARSFASAPQAVLAFSSRGCGLAALGGVSPAAAAAPAAFSSASAQPLRPASPFCGQAALLLAPRRPGLSGARGFRATTVTAGLKTGIVGLPNVGKVMHGPAPLIGSLVRPAAAALLHSHPVPAPAHPPQSTMFNALCENGKAQAANFPFCTIEPNVGVVAVPDARLELLRGLSGSERTVPTSAEFVDIAGLVKGASKGEGLGNQFLATIRECDAIVQVVRCFEDADVIHVSGRVDPLDDTDVINFELALSDVTQIEKRLERVKKGRVKAAGEEAKRNEVEAGALARVLAALETGRPARSVALNEEEADLGAQAGGLTGRA
jgi:hypothetical protein